MPAPRIVPPPAKTPFAGYWYAPINEFSAVEFYVYQRPDNTFEITTFTYWYSGVCVRGNPADPSVGIPRDVSGGYDLCLGKYPPVVDLLAQCDDFSILFTDDGDPLGLGRAVVSFNSPDICTPGIEGPNPSPKPQPSVLGMVVEF